MSHYDLCICIHGSLFILIYVVFSLSHCFAAVVLTATNKVEYIKRVDHISRHGTSPGPQNSGEGRSEFASDSSRQQQRYDGNISRWADRVQTSIRSYLAKMPTPAAPSRPFNRFRQPTHSHVASIIIMLYGPVGDLFHRADDYSMQQVLENASMSNVAAVRSAS